MHNNAIMYAKASCGRTSVTALRASTPSAYCRRYATTKGGYLINFCGKRRIHLNVVLCLLTLLAMPGLASQSAAQDIENLIKISGIKQELHEINGLVVEDFLAQNPHVKRCRTYVKEFYAERLSFEALQENVAAMYRGKLSEDEVHRLLAFYTTDRRRQSKNYFIDLSDGSVNPSLTSEELQFYGSELYRKYSEVETQVLEYVMAETESSFQSSAENFSRFLAVWCPRE